MTSTPHLGLPLIAAAQAQKHVTHNEALFGLDALVHLAVLDRDLATPPASPDEGDRYIVAGTGVGAWAGKGGQIAAWQDGAWRFYAPGLGWLAYIVDEGALLAWDGATWTDAIETISAFQNLTRFGLGTAADAVNPFAAKLNDALWTAREVAEGGSGDLRYKFNKEAALRTLSLLFQDGYSGRAEIGLVGDDDFRIKVSADGAVWKDALHVDRATGVVNVPRGLTGMAVPIMGNSFSSVTAGQTRYLWPGLNGASAPEVYLPVPTAGSFSGLTVVTSGAPGAGQSWTITLQRLFSDTALTCTIGPGTNQASDMTHVVTFAAGERWCLKIVASADAAASGSVLFSLKFTPTST
jgi:hypothetical protein